jgi:NAD(P)-dependent dehydrogenase (short-subunit alcohol dehydrogenase family)
MKRFGKPSEMIGAVLFLASQASTYTTGTVIVADGGYLAQ